MRCHRTVDLIPTYSGNLVLSRCEHPDAQSMAACQVSQVAGASVAERIAGAECPIFASVLRSQAWIRSGRPSRLRPSP